jgi:hypothetical protein
MLINTSFRSRGLVISNDFFLWCLNLIIRRLLLNDLNFLILVLFVRFRAVDYLGCGRCRRSLFDPVHRLRSLLLGCSSRLLLLLLRNYLYLSDFLLLSKSTSQHDVPGESQRGLREIRDLPVRGLRDVRDRIFSYCPLFLCLLGFDCRLFIIKGHFLVWHLLLLLLRSLGLATRTLVVLILGLLVVLLLFIVVIILASLLYWCLPLLVRDVSLLLL